MNKTDQNYETNLPLEKLLPEEALLVFAYNGEPLK
jgi:DMSO/TMAO reductase YedYZ molybdopterin-dependent catalytic subunit